MANAALQVDVDIAWNDPPSSLDPVWTRVTQEWLLEWEFITGRQAAMDLTTNPGQARIVFDNSQRQFDPTHNVESLSAGSWYPDWWPEWGADGVVPDGAMAPGRPVRIVFTYGTEERVVWQGIVGPEGFVQTGHTLQTSVATIDCVDLLGYASNLDVEEDALDPAIPLWGDATELWDTPTRLWETAVVPWAAGSTYDQAGRLCTSAGVPAAFGTDGRVDVPAITETPNLGDQLRELEKTELGRIIHDPEQGRLVGYTYEDLVTRERSLVTQWVLTDEPSVDGYRYSDPVLENVPIRNDITVTVTDGVPTSSRQTAAGSIAQYGRYVYSETLLSTNTSDAADVAALWLQQYADPNTVVSSVQLNPAGNTGLWPLVFGARLFDRVELSRRPHNIGTRDTGTYLLDGLTMRGGNGMDFGVSFYLTPTVVVVRGLWSDSSLTWSNPARRWAFTG